MAIEYEIAIFLLLGLGTGFLSGLFGIGGGILRLPLFAMVLPWMGLKGEIVMHVAVGTSVALIIPTAISSSLAQYRQGNLDPGYFSTWALGILIGVICGLLLVPYVSHREFQLAFLLLVSLMLIYLGLVPDKLVIAHRAPQRIAKFSLSSAIGLISALTGTGGGALTTPTLKAFEVPIKKAIAVASATGLVVGAIGATGYLYHGIGVEGRPHYTVGYVNLLVFLTMTPAILFAAPLGARLNNQLDDRLIKRGYAVLLLVIAIHSAYGLSGG